MPVWSIVLWLTSGNVRPVSCVTDNEVIQRFSFLRFVWFVEVLSESWVVLEQFKHSLQLCWLHQIVSENGDDVMPAF